MHILILGICGTFMAGLARLALERGHRVSGADKAAWPPMSTELARLGIPVHPYRVEDLSPAPDLVLIGNALSRGNPVVEAVLDRGLPYLSGPEWLGRELLAGRHVVAVAGTHGKTTTTALVTHVLCTAGHGPGWLLGGVAHDLPGSAHAGGAASGADGAPPEAGSPVPGGPFVVEADEYDTAFFDKRSKFLHYRPRTLVINHLEYDHADIFPDLAAIQTQFHHLVRTVPSDGRIIVRAGIPALEAMLARGCWTPVERFAVDQEAADAEGVAARARLLAADGRHFAVETTAGTVLSVRWTLRGKHNVANALAAFLATRAFGVAPAVFARACASFGGVRRRLESLGQAAGVEVFDDFAHHPTAIAATLAGLAANADGAGRVHAVLELRSNSLRAGEYRHELAPALAAADRVWVLVPAGLGWDVPASLAPLGSRARCLPTDDALIAAVVTATHPGDRIVCMSNGDFAGVPGRLLAALGVQGQAQA
jgi:UDP-N-acetylmuramate: L-alanyl-gamma-D-glutamyl-meso-diaminopimelate ligase